MNELSSQNRDNGQLLTQSSSMMIPLWNSSCGASGLTRVHIWSFLGKDTELQPRAQDGTCFQDAQFKVVLGAEGQGRDAMEAGENGLKEANSFGKNWHIHRVNER